ncbi:RNA methyltransferase, TrmH family [Chishuiella changwenlii]|uniref:RNA methyltransferase n=1 Tax=Chishuiella changwenlii TaxID=1434701 RepID=A0A1M6W8P9_9FLAO|nr:RNA methyltransferase [Chishuiella changwenlii]GGE88642.1 RNA methyltransferase [Chishuiella changwenlii]SHK90008.1 RNA methyltransferase, TrmH family [Chishuiella changwenlii]
MLSNNVIKIITSLSSKKYRQKYNLFVVEGVKNIGEVIKSSIKIKELFITEDFWPDENSIKKTYIDEKELKKISFLSTPNVGLALCELPSNDENIKLNGLTIALDDIRDPGNLGTIIRLADWFGVENILCTKESVDLYNPKVVMSTMGSFTRVKVHYIELESFLSTYEGNIFGTFMEGESIYEQKLPQEGILVMGNEANGISKPIENLTTNKLSIPFFGKNGSTESLNVAVATSVILGEFKSQISNKS